MLFLTIIFSISTIAVPAFAQSGDENVQAPPPAPDQSQFNGTYTSWSQQQNTTLDSWNWTNQAWEFGPYPNYAVYLENGTEVTNDNFIPLAVPFKIVMNIQKSIFIGNTTLGRAGLQWYTDLRTPNGTITGSANCRMVYINQMNTQFWNESNAWHVESAIFNQTGGDKGTPGTSDENFQKTASVKSIQRIYFDWSWKSSLCSDSYWEKKVFILFHRKKKGEKWYLYYF